MIHRSVQKDGIILEINVFYAFFFLALNIYFFFLFCFEERDRICIYQKTSVYKDKIYMDHFNIYSFNPQSIQQLHKI